MWLTRRRTAILNIKLSLKNKIKLSRDATLHTNINMNLHLSIYIILKLTILWHLTTSIWLNKNNNALFGIHFATYYLNYEFNNARVAEESFTLTIINY